MQASTRLVVTTVVLTACGGGGDSPEAGIRVPARSGELWELAQEDDRKSAPAALLAFVSGTHVMVLDGDDAFTGMTRVKATRGDGDSRSLELGNGIGARILPMGDGLELRFASGERIPLRKRVVREEEGK
jgi:hypothetical protein